MDHTVEHRTTRMPRGIRNSLLIAGLLITSSSLTQCRLVDSRTTGVDLTPSSASARSSCVHRCNEQYKAARKAEDIRTRAATKACKSDKACKKQEKALNKSIEDALSKQRKACKRNCYNEGAGIGGR